MISSRFRPSFAACVPTSTDAMSMAPRGPLRVEIVISRKFAPESCLYIRSLSTTSISGSSMVTSISFSWAPRQKRIRRLFPARTRPNVLRRSDAESMACSPIFTTMSPGSICDFAAGERGITRVISAPLRVVAVSEEVYSWGKSSLITPRIPRLISPYWISWAVSNCIRFMGMAKPIPILPPPGARMAVFMPISSPRKFTSAPPELPGLMEASVWMKSS